MTVFLYMEAFNIYSKTVFEDQVMLRTLVSVLMGLNFLICLIPNWKTINQSMKKKEEILSDYGKISSPEMEASITETKSKTKSKNAKKWIIKLLVTYSIVCALMLLAFEIALPKAMAISVIPCLNYGVAAETMFKTRKVSNAIYGAIGYYPFIALIFMYRVLESSSYGLPMKDDQVPFFMVTGFTTFKIGLSIYCAHKRNAKECPMDR